MFHNVVVLFTSGIAAVLMICCLHVIQMFVITTKIRKKLNVLLTGFLQKGQQCFQLLLPKVAKLQGMGI
jgi:hypothetical protein